MSFSHACAFNVVPLMARLVLGAAFIYAGYGKIFSNQTWTGEAAATLRELGVEGSAAAAVDADAEGDSASLQRQRMELRFASLRSQDEGQDQAGEEPAQDEGQDEGDVEGETGQDEPLVDPIEEPEIEQAPPPVLDDQDARPVHARKLYAIALTLRRAGIDQYEKALAWGVALTELVGGALILIGLFSRIWGLGLAIVMAAAFYTIMWPDFSADPYGFLGDNFDHFFSVAGRFVLAFGIFLTGPGAISADRLLFKHGHDEEPDVDLT